jgi:hypothetical protein
VEGGISRRELSWSPTIGSFEEGMSDLLEGLRTRRPAGGTRTGAVQPPKQGEAGGGQVERTS